MTNETFATAICCIDGRTIIPVYNFVKHKFNVEFVDMPTAPGLNKVLSNGDDNEKEIIKRKVDISVSAHKSKGIAIVGHYDCAGNPVCREDHINDIISACKLVKSWYPNLTIVGVFVNENWQAEEVFTI